MGQTRNPRSGGAADRRSRRWPIGGAVAVLVVAAAFLVVPSLAGVPARLVEGCGKWIAAAGLLELLSVLGFVVFFKLVFAGSIRWLRSVPAALRALGAATVLPAGGVVGPSMGAWSAGPERPSLSKLTRSTITFVILTNAPGAIVLAVVGTLLWLGLPGGPHETALTLVPAALALGLLALTWCAGRPAKRRGARNPDVRTRTLVHPGIALRDGVREARGLVSAGDWKLAGAIGYYAFDNAVLWAAFHAYGRTPPVGVIVMGYLVGSLAGALPLPAGLGAVDGGMIGALVLYGAPAAPAAAAVLLYRGVSLSVPVILGTIACTRVPAADRSRSGAGRRTRRAGAALAKRRAAAELAPASSD